MADDPHAAVFLSYAYLSFARPSAGARRAMADNTEGRPAVAALWRGNQDAEGINRRERKDRREAMARLNWSLRSLRSLRLISAT